MINASVFKCLTYSIMFIAFCYKISNKKNELETKMAKR